jgi:hypothetical protein
MIEQGSVIVHTEVSLQVYERPASNSATAFAVLMRRRVSFNLTA